MKKFNFYRIDEEAVVLIDNYSAKEYDIEPFVRGVHKSAYCIDDVRELLEAGRLEECLTYDDRYSSYGGDDEIKEIEVENFENPNDTVIEWLTLTWIEQERE